MSHYPRISEKRKVSHKKGRCIICGLGQADARLTIQINWFRGDDLVYKVHWTCVMAQSDDQLLKLVSKRWAS